MRNSRGKGLNIFIFCLVVGIILASVALFIKSKWRERVETEPVEAVSVSVMKVKSGSFVEHVEFAGRIEPFMDVLVATETVGRFTELHADVGKIVRDGDVLIKIDDALPQAAMLSARAEYNDALRDLERYRALSEGGAVSRSLLDAALRRMEFAKAGLADAEARLGKHTLTSPIDGRVEERFVEKGEYAGDGDVAFRISDLSKVKVLVHLPEADITDVQEGAEMSFTVSYMPDTVFTGKVAFAANTTSPMKHAFRVELVTDNSDGVLRAGVIANVLLERATRGPVVQIPFSAVLPRKGEHVVFVFENGVAVRRTVRLHSLAGESALVSAGLQDGELLIFEGQRFLQDGRVVSVVEPIRE